MTKVATENRPAVVSVSKNAAAQMLGRVIYLASRVALPPITLRFVSLEEYGIWSTCFLIVSYVGIGAFGVSNVYIRFTAEYNATGRQREIGALLGVGMGLSLAFSAGVMAALWALLPWLDVWFKIPAHLKSTADVLILGTVATMLLDMTLGSFAYVLQGVHKIVAAMTIWVSSFLLETFLIIFLLVKGFGVQGLLIAFAARYLFSTVLYIALCYRSIPGLKLSFFSAGRDKFRLFMSQGGLLTLISLLSTVLYSCERVIAGAISGIAAVGLLDIGQKFPVMASQFFSASSSYLTALTHYYATEQHDQARRLYLQIMRYTNMFNGCAMGFMAAFGLLIITAWMGDNPINREAVTVMLYTAIGMQLQILTAPTTNYHQSVNRPSYTLPAFIIPQFVLLGMALPLALAWRGPGILAVVTAMAGARVASSLLFMLLTNRRMNIGFWEFSWEVLLPGALPYAIGFALAWVAQPWLSTLGASRLLLLPALAAMGLAYALACGLLMFSIFSKAEERAKLSVRFARKFG